MNIFSTSKISFFTKKYVKNWSFFWKMSHNGARLHPTANMTAPFESWGSEQSKTLRRMFFLWFLHTKLRGQISTWILRHLVRNRLNCLSRSVNILLIISKFLYIISPSSTYIARKIKLPSICARKTQLSASHCLKLNDFRKVTNLMFQYLCFKPYKLLCNL